MSLLDIGSVWVTGHSMGCSAFGMRKIILGTLHSMNSTVNCCDYNPEGKCYLD